ncbi:MAG: T9SS type A sorting domain-containing protein [candidate division WOR-3 bacterium]
MRNFLLFLIMLKMSIAVTLPADIKINEPEVLDKQKFSALSVIPIVNSVNFSAIDSSIYAYSLWTQSQENIGYNPHISALMFTCNDYGYYLRINVSQTDNLFSFSLTDVGVYNAQLGGVRNPNAIASGFDFAGTGPHISYSCGYMEQALMVGQFESGGWWSSYWDPPVDLGPGINKAWWNIGKQFPNGNILFIAVTIENYSDDRKIIYRTYNCNLTTQLAGGYINPDYRRYWGFDINNGIAYIFYYDTLLNIYYRTTTDGINWSSEQVYNMVWPEPFDSNLVFWTQAVVMDNGEPKLIFDNIDYQDYIAGNYPMTGKIYVSPGSGQVCREISTGLNRNFYPTIATGGDYLIGLWHSQAGAGQDSLAFWNLYYNYSTDGGLTWHTPRNITGSFGYRHGLAQIAKRIDTQNNQFFYVFGQDMVADLDPIWMCWKGWQYSHPARWYWGRQAITGIQEQKQEKPQKFSLNISPNPVRDNAVITYTIPEAGHISLKVYSIDGRLVRIIENGFKNAGRYALNYSFRDLNSGVYLVLLEKGNYSLNTTIVIVSN